MNQTKRFWLGLAVILVAAAILRFTGYNFGLPYINQSDEPMFATQVLVARGLYNQSSLAGYPPGILLLHAFGQLIVEQFTHRPSILTVGYAIEVVRFCAVLTSLITIVIVGLLARQLGGNIAGWVAAAAWTAVPIVAYHSVVALAEPWLLLFCALALYWALVGLTSDRPEWLVLSTVAGLLAVLFKYSAYPVLGAGTAAALWRLKVQGKARRGTWLRILAIQVVCIGLVACFLFVVNGAAQASSYLSQGGFSHFVDVAVGTVMLIQSIVQLGLRPLVLGTILVVGVFAYYRGTTPSRLIGWIIVAGFALISIWLVQTYTQEPYGSAPRHMLSGDIAFVALFSASLAQIGTWLGRRLGQYSVGAALVGSFAAVWLLPMAATTWTNVRQQSLPDTRAALAQWSLEALEDGSIIVNLDNERTFNREWGGYTGPYRVALVASVTNRSLADWRREYVNYAVMSQDGWKAMQQSDTGRTYLDQMLLLKCFPPPGQRWQGPSIAVFRLWKMDIEEKVRFGERILLTGYDRSAEQAKPGDTLSLRFYWKALAVPETNYSLFIHLTPLTARTILAQADGAPVSVNRPTVLWNDSEETLIGAPFQLKIPADLPIGQYRVLIGLYDYMTGQRLLTETGEDYFHLFTLTIR